MKVPKSLRTTSVDQLSQLMFAGPLQYVFGVGYALSVSGGKEEHKGPALRHEQLSLLLLTYEILTAIPFEREHTNITT